MQSEFAVGSGPLDEHCPKRPIELLLANPRPAGTPATRLGPQRAVKTFRCSQCHQTVYFANVRCEACGSALGFLPEERAMAAFDRGEVARWKRIGGEGKQFRRPCKNYTAHDVCNWMLPEESTEEYCASCRLTQVIPDLTKPENKQHWYKLELAKRRFIYSLQGLGLPIRNRVEDPESGLGFQFLEDFTPEQRVLTGHANGVITLNIAEADDAKREQMRTSMGEPYRTLLGHFRHEIGHYYWDLLIKDTPLLPEFRRLFGDEQADYSASLKRHYEQGPPLNWEETYISSYATMHPWEDWAECFAHYLHMVDALHTAEHWGFTLQPAAVDRAPVERVDIRTRAKDFDTLLFQQWLPLTRFLNSLNRSLGQNDAYPFTVPAPVVEKLRFIDVLIRGRKWEVAVPELAAANAVAPAG